jgi:hypothetical protein
VQAVPVFASYTLEFALQLRKKHGKTSARVSARTTQADTVKYKNINGTIYRRKRVVQSSTMTQNNKERRTQQIENNYR